MLPTQGDRRGLPDVHKPNPTSPSSNNPHSEPLNSSGTRGCGRKEVRSPFDPQVIEALQAATIAEKVSQLKTVPSASAGGAWNQSLHGRTADLAPNSLKLCWWPCCCASLQLHVLESAGAMQGVWTPETRASKSGLSNFLPPLSLLWTGHDDPVSVQFMWMRSRKQRAPGDLWSLTVYSHRFVRRCYPLSQCVYQFGSPNGGKLPSRIGPGVETRERDRAC